MNCNVNANFSGLPTLHFCLDFFHCVKRWWWHQLGYFAVKCKKYVDLIEKCRQLIRFAIASIVFVTSVVQVEPNQWWNEMSRRLAGRVVTSPEKWGRKNAFMAAIYFFFILRVVLCLIRSFHFNRCEERVNIWKVDLTNENARYVWSLTKILGIFDNNIIENILVCQKSESIHVPHLPRYNLTIFNLSFETMIIALPMILQRITCPITHYILCSKMEK